MKAKLSGCERQGASPRAARSSRPSGEQYELVHGEERAIVVEVGGGLRSYTRGGWDILDGYGEDEMCSGARGQPLIPWPNRLRDGHYSFAGCDYQLPLSEPERRNAIHGLVRWASWSPAERERDRIVMRHLLRPRPGYPFTLALAIEYRLSDGVLTVSTTATNVGPEACPYGAGCHPYISVGADSIDELVLRAPGCSWLRTDDRELPVATEPVEGTEFDFREPRAIGTTKLDTAFADLERDACGCATVELRGEDRTVAVWLDRNYAYLMLFTGDSLPDSHRRRKSLGVEPMTCAPNAFASGDGLRVLQPGESFTATWGIIATSGTG